MVTQYKVVLGKWGGEQDIDGLVTKEISGGWVPVGGVSVYLDEDRIHRFAQAMIKESEK